MPHRQLSGAIQINPNQFNMNLLRLLTVLALLPLTLPAAFPTLYLKNVCDDQLHAPTNITNAGDGSGRLFICDQPGKVFIFEGGMLLPTPFLDLTATGTNEVVTFGVGYSERGLLGMCFHPGFSNPASPGYRCFYVNFTAPATHPTLNPFPTPGPTTGTNCVTVIAEYKVSLTNPNVADPSTKRIVLTYAQPQANHNGGQLEFGPDGFLYIASGDGGGANDNPAGHSGGAGNGSPGRVTGALGNGQDRRFLLGKILRINPLDPDGAGPLTYAIPSSNPFVGQTQDLDGTSFDGAMRGEIFAYGVRNPWRFSFDANFGGAARLICADVGQIDVEEINFITIGGNYGWRVKEGNVGFDTVSAYAGVGVPTLTDPIAQYTHSTVTLPGLSVSSPITGTSITGGYVYRGSAIPSMQGKYVFADYAAIFSSNANGGGGGKLLGLEETTPGNYAMTILTVANPLPSTGRIYCFGEDESGELFVSVKTTQGVLELDGGKPSGTIYKLQSQINATVTCPANLDNSMYEGLNYSNGIGQGLFSGKTGAAAGEALRRALVRFDLSTIPTGATLSSANVQLTITKQIADPVTYTLHRVTNAWGEGNSNAPNGNSSSGAGGLGVPAQTNDATWNHRLFPSTLWSTPGGDHIGTVSGSGATEPMFVQPILTLSGSGLLTDLQSWLTAPATNFGWLLKGQEGAADAYTATRFASRQHTSASQRPKLNVSYSAPPTATRFETWYSTHFPTSPPGTYLDLAGDNDGDGIANLIEYAYNFSPTTQNAADAGLTTAITNDTINTNFTVTFRRDPTATDLTYELQTCDDLVSWNTIVESVAGAAPTGTGYVSESVITGQSPMRAVVASEDLPGIEALTHFVRLKITRNP